MEKLLFNKWRCNFTTSEFTKYKLVLKPIILPTFINFFFLKFKPTNALTDVG